MNDNIVSALRNMHANIPSGLTEVSNILSAVSQTHSGILDSAKSIVSELYAVRDEVIRPIEKLTMPAVITSMTTLQSAISAVIPCVPNIYGKFYEHITEEDIKYRHPNPDNLKDKCSKLFNETFDTIPLDNDTKTDLKSLVEHINEHPVSKIICLIASIISILGFLLGLIPNTHTDKSISSSKTLTDLNSEDFREMTEKLIELNQQYVELLSEIDEISGQQFDVGE